MGKKNSKEIVDILKMHCLSSVTCRSIVKAQGLSKDGGFVKEDNSGRSNVFSTGEKALYSYSPAEKVAKRGLGGFLGLSIVLTIVALVALATVSISTEEARVTASNIDLTNLDSLTEISTRLK